MQRLFSKDFILPNLLVLPMVSHWLLPDGIEKMLYLSILGLIFYLPNLLYFIYLFNYHKYYSQIKPFSISSNKKIVIFASLIYFFLVHIAYYGIASMGDAINIVVNNFPFLYSFFLFFYFPLPSKDLDKTKYVLAFSLIVISLEIILYSTGILTYTAAGGDGLTDGGYEMGGIFRISTTVGAATGTGVVVNLLGIVCTSFFKFSNKIKLSLLGLTTVAIFFTISRGSIIVWCVYLALYIYKFYLTGGMSMKKILVLGLICAAAIWAVNHGLIDPLIERQSIVSSNDNLLTDRDERYDQAIEIFKSSYFLGIGSGMVRPDKSLLGAIATQYHFSPHNAYLLMLAELGMVGILVFIGLYWSILKNLNYKKVHALIIPIILLVTFNTENFVLEQECFPMFVLLLLVSYKYYQEDSCQFV